VALHRWCWTRVLWDFDAMTDSIPALACNGLAPFGYPRFPGKECTQPAVFYVWPKCEPQITGYSVVCAEHLAELRRLGHEIYQVSETATQRVVFLDGRAIAGGV
jgi:hypothetical protein